jgi:hypothetical protein
MCLRKKSQQLVGKVMTRIVFVLMLSLCARAFGAQLISPAQEMSAQSRGEKRASATGASDKSASPQTGKTLVGEVASADSNAEQLTVKTDAGETVTVKMGEKASYRRVQADDAALSRSVAILFADIAAGDRVYIRALDRDGELKADRVIVLSKSEIDKKKKVELEDWRRRGVFGVVKELNQSAQEIIIETRGTDRNAPVRISAAKCQFRRYSPTSASFEEARPSSIGAVRVGDQLWALGERSEDRASLRAEEVVSGSFKTIGVSVTAVNAEKSEITGKTLDRKVEITLCTTKNSALHRINPQLVSLIAARILAGKPTSGAAPSPGSNKEKVEGRTNEAPAPSIQKMIDALPHLSLSDIKVGDVMAVTSADNGDNVRMTVIKGVAGVDAILAAIKPPAGKHQVIPLSAGLPLGVFDFSVGPQ